MQILHCPNCGTEPEHIHIYDGEEIIRCPNSVACRNFFWAGGFNKADAVKTWNEGVRRSEGRREEHIACIEMSRKDYKGYSWCGRNISCEFCFTGLDHAANNGAQDGRLVACKTCTAEAIIALTKGQEGA